MVLICIYLTNEVEYLFMFLLAIWIYFFSKYLFKSLSQFPVVVFVFSC